MKKRIIVALLCAAMILTALAGCGSRAGEKDGDSGESAEVSAQKKAAQVSDTGYPITLDNYGRKITVQSAPKKVLALGPNCAELLVALGLEDSIVGTSLRNHSRGPLPEYAKALEAIPEINHSSATREAVISSGADFVYGIDWEFGGDGLDVDELEDYGMTTYINSATTLEEQYQEILDLGNVFGIEDRTAEYVKEQEERIQAVQDKVKNEKPLKVLVYDSGSDGVFTCSGTNFESLLIELAGGENLFQDVEDKAWVTVSYEEALSREPDIILVHDYDSPSVEEKIEEIKANDVLSKLSCVKNERFATIDLESVLPGDRLAYTVEKLSEAFYPAAGENTNKLK
ncbi:ABC transporter substrate-binding protein [Clostridium sp. C105KSO13]|uniref:ABC transporter substrate-binding protein n=1 Tax=Clostridium sp. C105KSO13 TaxID=1776045 RepID=UPI0007406D86|nr:ABC transporter substrate-binding protein [Clostridium sp. C105KSO13]CUX21375.1 Vitamin B12-binding protein precursor [Clostridium sp. C105KSO13]